MKIDWLTVAAQIVNFLVLVWLLKRFLYGPLAKAMRDRERHIENRLDSAAQREQAAEEEAERYRRDKEALAMQKKAILDEAQREAEKALREMNDKAKAEVDGLRQRWLADLNKEQNDILVQLKKRITQHITRATSRALTELADATLEAQAVRLFLKRLRALDEEAKRPLMAALSDEALVVITAFELTPALREEISAALTELCDKVPRIRFEQKTELTFGIELAAPEHLIRWNMADYVADIERDMASSLQRNPGVT